MILEIFKNSFILLFKKPKVLIPRLITTFLYSIYFLLIAKFIFEYSTPILIEKNYYLVKGESLFSNLFFMFSFLFILLVIDLITYAMYPKIVHDYYFGKRISLKKAFKEAIHSWKILFVFGFVLILVSIILSIFIGFFSLIAFITNVSEFLFIALIIAFLFILLVMVFLFFVIPISVIQKKKNIFESFQESFELSLKHKKELFLINFGFLILYAFTFMLVFFTEFKGAIAFSAVVVFIIARLIQALIYTYFFIMNPYFYLHILHIFQKK